MSTKAPTALRADACPEPEQLAAFIDGRLPPDERTQVERHLSECADCREMVADSVEILEDLEAFERAQPAGRPPVALKPRRSPLTLWAGVGVALAAAAAIVIAVRLQRPSPYYEPEMAELVAVQSPTRATEPRLTGGFPYAPPPPVMRGTGDAGNLELRATAERVRNEIAQRPGADADAARGVASLVAGDVDRAIEALEHATGSGSTTARMFSDLAAAYLQRGLGGDAERALTASQRALAADATLNEAAFNRALALERLGRTSDALQAWRDYAAHETDAQWAAEARTHVGRLSSAG